MTIITIQPYEWKQALPRIRHVRQQTTIINRRVSGYTPISSVDLYGVYQNSDWRCCCCGAHHDSLSKGLLADYRIPLHIGGRHEADNLKVVCSDCWHISRFNRIEWKHVPPHYVIPAARRRPAARVSA